MFIDGAFTKGYNIDEVTLDDAITLLQARAVKLASMENEEEGDENVESPKRAKKTITKKSSTKKSTSKKTTSKKTTDKASKK